MGTFMMSRKIVLRIHAGLETLPSRDIGSDVRDSRNGKVIRQPKRLIFICAESLSHGA